MLPAEDELRSWLARYSEDVISCRITSCVKHKMACQRFLRDLTREGSESFPFVFEPAKAYRFLKWTTFFKHRKGVLAGQHIEPHPIQTFVFGNIYGWVHKDTGRRRFRKGYWQVARKNAKSQSLAMMGIYENFAFGVPSAEIYCAATKTDQAKIVWEEAEWLTRNCEFLKGKFKVSYGKISHLKSGSFIRAMSKEDKKTGDGYSPQLGIIDEYHAHETSEVYDIIVSGQGARFEPFIMIITTAGFELARPCYSVEYNYVTQILDPDNPIENDQYFIMINELDEEDDIQDERVWPKANPILCSYPEGREYLKSEIMVALAAPEKMRNFLTKNMNKWVQISEGGYMRMDKWTKCGTDKLPDLRGTDCYVGVDLSKRIDITSIAFEFVVDDDYVVLNHNFMPEEVFQEKLRVDKVPYDLWVKQGWITLTPGAVVDYNFVMHYIEDEAEKNGWVIREICYDPYNATQFANEMMDRGYACWEIRQGYQTLSDPTKCFREKVYSGHMKHNKNPVLTWALGNAIVRQDEKDNIILDKKRSRSRIDPIAAIINAHVRARINEDTTSIYETGEVKAF